MLVSEKAVAILHDFFEIDHDLAVFASAVVSYHSSGKRLIYLYDFFDAASSVELNAGASDMVMAEPVGGSGVSIGMGEDMIDD